MKKRALALVLTLVMALSLLAGCGGGGQTLSNDGGELPSEPEEGIVLKVGVPQSANISSYTDNDFTKWIEEQLGIELKFTYYAGSEGVQQFSLDCAAGKDIPDVVWGFHSMSNYQLGDLGEDGYIFNVRPYLESHFPNLQAALKNVPEADRKTAMEKGINPDDGAYYGLPLIALEHCDNSAFMYINKKWLDKVGKDVPTTTDELYDVLVAFRDGDPNGNGKKDEVPMVSAGTEVIRYVMNAFVYWDPANIYNVTDGKIWSALETDEFREGLKFLNKLYEEKLISELCFSGASTTDFIQLNTPADQVAKAGIWMGHASIYTDSNTTILDQYVNLPWLDDATGRGGYAVYHENTVRWVSWITTSCKYPQAAMRFLDLMYTDEAMTRMRMGEKGVFWDYGEEGVNVKGEPTNIYVYDDSAFFGGNSTWGINGNCIMTDANYTGVTGQETPGTRAYEINRLFDEMWNVIIMQKNRYPAEKAENLIYTTDDFDRRQEIYPRHWSYFTEAINLFITGKIDIEDDAEWTAFQNQIAKLGQAELIEIAQRAYDREQGVTE